MRVYDFEFIEELIEKTIERDLKECSYWKWKKHSSPLPL
jgi:hypothetical protein